MAKITRTLAQTDEIIKSSARAMESTADTLDKMARAVEAVLGRTHLVSSLVGEAGALRMHARQSLARIKP